MAAIISNLAIMWSSPKTSAKYFYVLLHIDIASDSYNYDNDDDEDDDKGNLIRRMIIILIMGMVMSTTIMMGMLMTVNCIQILLLLF